MGFKIKIIEILDDLKSKSNHDFDFKIKIVPISVCYSKYYYPTVLTEF